MGEVRSDAESSPQRVAHKNDNLASPHPACSEMPYNELKEHCLKAQEIALDRGDKLFAANQEIFELKERLRTTGSIRVTHAGDASTREDEDCAGSFDLSDTGVFPTSPAPKPLAETDPVFAVLEPYMKQLAGAFLPGGAIYTLASAGNKTTTKQPLDPYLRTPEPVSGNDAKRLKLAIGGLRSIAYGDAQTWPNCSSREVAKQALKDCGGEKHAD
jgi:hypothetical protein